MKRIDSIMIKITRKCDSCGKEMDITESVDALLAKMNFEAVNNSNRKMMEYLEGITFILNGAELLKAILSEKECKCTDCRK